MNKEVKVYMRGMDDQIEFTCFFLWVECSSNLGIPWVQILDLEYKSLEKELDLFLTNTHESVLRGPEYMHGMIYITLEVCLRAQ